MGVDQDLERINLQEKRLRFERFDAGVAWEIGSRLRALAEKRGKSVAIDIHMNGHPLFFCAMPGTTPDNVDWLRRKRNVVNRFHHSSYGVGLYQEKKKQSLETKYGLELRDYAPHGGGFPVFLGGTACVGSIIVSGLPQREDHEMVVEVLAEYLKVPLNEVALSPAGS